MSWALVCYAALAVAAWGGVFVGCVLLRRAIRLNANTKATLAQSARNRQMAEALLDELRRGLHQEGRGS